MKTRMAGRMIALGVAVLGSLAVIAEQPNAAQAVKDRTVVETLLRLKGVDVNAVPAWKAAAVRHLESLKGTTKYVDLVEKLKLRGVEDELFRLAMEDPKSTAGARAAVLLAAHGEAGKFIDLARGRDEPLAIKAISAISAIGDAAMIDALQEMIVAPQLSGAVRVAAADAIGRNRRGQHFLLELAQSKRLPEELKFTVSNILLSSADEAIRSQAARFLTLPASADKTPIPPIAELIKMRGDAHRGRQLFQTAGTCAKCHKAQGEGKDVGPDLSEIGSKLSKDAAFVSILDPNAGISHNYESYVAETSAGKIVTGLLINRTEQSITLRTAEGIDTQIPASEVEELQKSKTSLMPADLQKLLSVQDLVDVVEYLSTLTKAG